MHEGIASPRDRTPAVVPSVSAASSPPVEHPTAEFVGASDDTIAEAVRRALARATQTLRTLEGAGVLIVPQIYRPGTAPRFRVTLKVTPPSAEQRRVATAASILAR